MLPHLFNNLFILTGMLFSIELGSDFTNLFFAASNFVFIGTPLFGLNYFWEKGFGGGDVKMASALTIWFGFSKALFVLFFAFGLSLCFVVPLLIFKRISLKSPVRFGPFLGMASLGVWFWPEIIELSKSLIQVNL